MDFFEGLGKKITDVGEVALAKGKELAETGKTNLNIKEEERKISEAYEEIGRKYVQNHQAEAAAEFTEAVSRIRASEDRISKLREELDDIKKSDTCKNCGAPLSIGAKFCNSCGQEVR